MFDSVVLTAFTIGLISAVSLPMGTLTMFFWHPTDRTIAIFMAFGSGALLAALTIDLVGSALQQGHFEALAIGAILGGLMFVGLNRIINDYGGFLRKVSTTVYYLRRKQHQRLQRISQHLRRVDLFQVLPDRDFEILAASIVNVELNKGSWIFQCCDPSDNLYILIDGNVALINPRDRNQSPEHLKKYDVFGWRAIITGTPYSYSALAQSKVSLWVLPKRAIEALNLNSEESREKVHELLRSESILNYLQRDQGLSLEQASQWLDLAVDSLRQRGVITPAIEVRRKSKTFRGKIDCMLHIPLLQGLPPFTRKLISERLIYKSHARGTSIYHQYEMADRMFIIDQGEVNLFDVNASSRDPIVLRDYDAFGDISMITGAKHSVTAIAAVDTTVWELRKADFDELLEQSPELRDRVRIYIHQAGADGYLVSRQQIDAENTERWMRQAMRSIDAGLPIPAAADIRREITENKGAPLAIWMGITLDGIPESLVIGASMIHEHLEISLITGLFLANYPEALSSSIGMRRQGMAKSRILWMWTSLMLLTGVGAALGSVFFIGASPSAYALVEGLAAGAMLTMIAETMLPEAYFKGGSVVGISTLMGFLVAIFSKTLE